MSRLLYESVSATALTRATVFRDSETGVPLIRHSQDVVPIIEANKRDAKAYVTTSRPMAFWAFHSLPCAVARLSPGGFTA